MNKLNKSISEIWDDNYVVPLYQRNYAWQEQQIRQLLQDIYDNSKNPESRYYIGSLVVLQRPDGVYEVIDGQQRLTTLHIICKYLGLLNNSHLTYDSRPEVEDFFKGLFMSATSREYVDECNKRDNRKIFRLVDAIDIVESTEIHTNPGSSKDEVITLSSMSESQIISFKEYLNNNVILVRTILPNDTDVAAYFEIMNNRGEQLQEHEVVKALMMKNLNEKDRSVFSAIWDACSQMDIPIQKGLSDYRRNQEYPLFGKNYDTLELEYLAQYNIEDKLTSPLSIDEVLTLPNKYINNEDVDREAEAKYEAIIDFPNFLMLLFKLKNSECQLNANYLLSTYNELKENINSMLFITTMLKVRTLFDRYVIKAQGENEEDENLKWIMLKPYSSKEMNSLTLKFRNTFSNRTDDANENEEEEDIQKKIIMQESMLQVSFRNKKYKNWLFELLQWLNEKEVDNVNPKELSAFLDKWIVNYYYQLDKKTKSAPNTEWSFEALGTDTPHFVFNFIDYLYWIASITKRANIRYIDEVDNFYFRYYNSIEHHLPQSYKDTENVNVDNIANLCLISRRKNSSLNDKAPKEKAKMEQGLQPKRKIMYRITHDSNGLWGRKQILDHYEDIKSLLQCASEILSLDNPQLI